MSDGTLYGVGVGPGDPELLTLKAVRLITASPVIAYPAAEQRRSIAREIASAYLTPEHIELALRFPLSDTTGPAQRFYDETARELSSYLGRGLDVAVLCEGDPLLYGTFMYVYTRLAERFRTEIVPGISSLTASASMLGVPLAYRNDVFSVIPAGLDRDTLRDRLSNCDGAVLIKLARYFETVRDVLRELGLARRACYIERATTEAQRVVPLDDVDPAKVPYFSMIVVPSAWSPS